MASAGNSGVAGIGTFIQNLTSIPTTYDGPPVVDADGNMYYHYYSTNNGDSQVRSFDADGNFRWRKSVNSLANGITRGLGAGYIKIIGNNLHIFGIGVGIQTAVLNKDTGDVVSYSSARATNFNEQMFGINGSTAYWIGAAAQSVYIGTSGISGTLASEKKIQTTTNTNVTVSDPSGIVDSSGNIYIVFKYGDSGSVNRLIYVQKYDSSYTLLWSKRYTSPDSNENLAVGRFVIDEAEEFLFLQTYNPGALADSPIVRFSTADGSNINRKIRYSINGGANVDLITQTLVMGPNGKLYAEGDLNNWSRAAVTYKGKCIVQLDLDLNITAVSLVGVLSGDANTVSIDNRRFSDLGNLGTSAHFDLELGTQNNYALIISDMPFNITSGGGFYFSDTTDLDSTYSFSTVAVSKSFSTVNIGTVSDFALGTIWGATDTSTATTYTGISALPARTELIV